MHGPRRGLGLLVLCHLMLVPSLAAGEEATRAGTVSRFATPPTIDGVIERGEWNGAMRVTGFQHRRGGEYIEDRLGASYFGFTDDTFYVAVVTELPPDQELVAERTTRDAVGVIKEDGIEIWFDPNRSRRGNGKGDLSYYQLMMNSIGSVYDCRFDPAGGAPDTGWNADWNIVHGIHKEAVEDFPIPAEHGVWVMEMSVKAADFGIDEPLTGHRVGMLIARNWKRPGGQMTWFPHGHAFSNWAEYPVVALTENEPSVQILGLGGRELFKGHLVLQAKIHNPGPARQAAVTAVATSSDMPGVEKEDVLDLPANGDLEYVFEVPEGRFHLDARHAFRFRVEPAGEGAPYLAYRAEFRAPKKDAWNVRTGPDPAAAVKTAHYPSYGFVKVFIDPRELGEEAAGITEATVTVQNQEGEELAAERLTWQKPPVEKHIEIGEMPAGEYTVRIALAGVDEVFERRFVREVFPWEGNDLGKTNVVLPPFEPVEVAGEEVRVVMRRYGVGGLGLWDSVQARSNRDPESFRELLAAPVTVRVDDGAVLTGEGSFTETAPHAVVYEGAVAHPAVTLKSTCTTMYDGALKVALTLEPGTEEGRELQALWVEIPIRDEMAPLFHVCTTSLRSNPAGRTPAGEGRVWDTREFPDGEWYGNFKPYIWVGGAERGLCFFGDNDRGWVLQTGDSPEEYAPCQELVREDGVLTMRVNLVQRPILLEKPREIVFGLMASPGKPMPEDWRSYLFEHNYPERQKVEWIGASYWGSPTIMYSKYPIGGDFSIISKMQENRLTGSQRDNDGFLEVWAARHLEGDISDKTYQSRAKMLQLAGIALRRSGLQPDWFTVYWEEFHRTLYQAELPTFQREWTGSYKGSTHHSYPPSYLDFAAWYGAEFLRRGVGLYFDNTFPKRGKDPVTTNAYVNAQGFLQPSANMWRQREYLRRIWILHQQLAPAATKPIMMLHMTNSHVVPYMVFNMSNLDLEWFYGPEPAQSKYAADLLRAESIGLQTGNLPCALAAFRSPQWDKASAEEKHRAMRTRFGALMVHEIRVAGYRGAERNLMDRFLAFGYGLPDCTVYNYWQTDHPVAVSNEQLKTLLLERDGKLMLLAASWNSQPEEVTVTLDTAALGVDPSQALNVETEKTLPVRNGALQLTLEGYDIRLLEFAD